MAYFQKRYVGGLEQGSDSGNSTKAVSVDSRGGRKLGNHGYEKVMDGRRVEQDSLFRRESEVIIRV